MTKKAMTREEFAASRMTERQKAEAKTAKAEAKAADKTEKDKAERMATVEPRNAAEPFGNTPPAQPNRTALKSEQQKREDVVTHKGEPAHTTQGTEPVRDLRKEQQTAQRKHEQETMKNQPKRAYIVQQDHVHIGDKMHMKNDTVMMTEAEARLHTDHDVRLVEKTLKEE